MSMTWRSASSRSPIPGCLTARLPGGAFFEGLIRDHLDLGRPDQVSLTFGKKVTTRTPGTFRTKVITRGVDPEIVSYYKSSRLKQ